MHIIGIGTEIVECLRIGRMIELHGEQFLTRVYTAEEIHFCQGRRRSMEHFAARWAAKEAVLKALGTPWRRGMQWTDLNVKEEPGLPLEIEMRGGILDLAQGIPLGRLLTSMSHCRAYATATVIALRD